MLAMRDRATEDALYDRFTAFFRVAEGERRWNLWNDVPWDAVSDGGANAALTDAVMAAYTQELFLPDLSAKILRLLRSSRGRAWFLTRWSYEEGKHLLTLGEWLVRSGSRTDGQLKEYADDLLERIEWDLAVAEPVPAMVEALLREYGEIERYQQILKLADAARDGALVAVCNQLIADEEGHRDFFRDALHVIHKGDAALVSESVRRVLDAGVGEAFADRLRADLGLGGE